MKRIQIHPDAPLYLTKYKPTLKAISVRNTRSAFCHAQPQHPVRWKNSLLISLSPILFSNVAGFSIWIFFPSSVTVCLKDDMNESGFAGWVTMHYQHFNDFNDLLDNSRTGKKIDSLSQTMRAKLFKSSLGMF